MTSLLSTQEDQRTMRSNQKKEGASPTETYVRKWTDPMSVLLWNWENLKGHKGANIPSERVANRHGPVVRGGCKEHDAELRDRRGVSGEPSPMGKDDFENATRKKRSGLLGTLLRRS